MSTPSRDRNLLVGMLALQMDFITRDQLIAGLQSWVQDKSRPLEDLLHQAGALDDDLRNLVANLADRHLRQHGGDPQRSLAALTPPPALTDVLTSVDDPDVNTTLTFFGQGQPSLAETDVAPNGLGAQPPALAAQTTRATASADAGDSTGNGTRFRILRPHARGGLGEVSVAEDRELHREVALKEIQNRFVRDPSSRARFLLEAEITGGLEHPGIVPVYGLGSYPDGRPYYAMRFIKGDSLHETIRQFHSPEAAAGRGPLVRSLEFRRLLGRFIDVCQAMEYAHSRGVLHRDLKPGNIMLGKYGETLVVDWGLARARGRQPSARPGEADEQTLVPHSGSGVEATQMGAVIGTPAYMSPEQAAGRIDELDTTSDVYGLGATLYALLTGKPPIEGGHRDQALRRVEQGDIPSPRNVQPGVPKPLEAICRKAMARLPAERYASARELADEIEHWLADEPVTAHREPLWQRASRWLRKHQAIASTAAATLLLTLIAAGIVVLQQNAHAKVLAAQTRKAEAREAMAIDAVKQFRDAVAENEVLKGSPALHDLRKTLLKEPLKFFQKLRDELQQDNDTRPESLDRLGSAAFELGHLTYEIGDKQDALAAFQQALEIRQRLADENPTVTEYQSNLAASHHNIGVLLSQTGKPDEALAVYQQALEIRQRLARENPTVTEYQSDLAGSHNNIGVLLSGTGKPDEALAAHQQALEIKQRLARENPTVNVYQSRLALSHNNIGNLLRETGKPDEALAAHQQALEIHERLARENPTVIEYQSGLAVSHNNIGVLLSQTGKPDQALAALQQALEIQQRLARENPTVTEYVSDLAASHNNIGLLLSETGKPDEALAAYQQALEIKERLARENPTVTEYQSDLAASHNQIGVLLSETGKPDEALAAYQQAQEIWQRLARENPTVTEYQSRLALSHYNIGRLLRQTGKPDEALAAYQQALEIRQRLARENPTVTEYQSDLAASHNNIGNVLSETGMPDDALAAYQQALEIRHRLAGENPTVTDYQSRLAGSHNSIGLLLRETGKPDEALAAYQQALEIKERLARENPTVTEYQSNLALSHNSIGNVLRETGKPDEALAAYQKALEIWQRLARENAESPDLASDVGGTLNNIALIEMNEGRFAEARDRLRQAVDWQRKALSTNAAHPTYRQFLTNHYNNLMECAQHLTDPQLAEEAQAGLAELEASDPMLAALDQRLAAVMNGEPATDNVERLALAQRAYGTKRFAIAARLWTEAFDSDPSLIENRQTQHAYNAACAAALAGSGQASDEPAPDDGEKAALRARALAWLQGEIALWKKLLETVPPEQRAAAVDAVRQNLAHWQTDPDLAGVRGEATDQLPESEREPWRTLWSEVEQLVSPTPPASE